MSNNWAPADKQEKTIDIEAPGDNSFDVLDSYWRQRYIDGEIEAT